MKNSIQSLLLLLLTFYSPLIAQDTVWTGSYPGYINNALFSPDDSKILVSGNNAFLEVNPANGAIIKQLPSIGKILGLSGDKIYIVTDSQKVLDVNTYNVVKDFSSDVNAFGMPWSISYDANLKIFVNVYQRGWPRKDTIVFIDGETLKIKKLITDSAAYQVYSEIRVSPDGKYFAEDIAYYGDPSDKNDNYNVIRLFSMETFQMIKEIKSYGALQFSPDSKMLAVHAGAQHDVFSIPSGELIHSFPINSYCVAFSNDSRYIYFGSGGILSKYNLIDYKQVYQINQLFSFELLCLSNNQKYVLSGNQSQLFLFKDKATEVENPHIDTIIVYPNPTNSIVTISNNCTNMIQFYKIYNENGTLIQTTNVVPNTNQIIIDFSQNPIGVYFVNLYCASNYSTYKIVKE
jgi:hypothetical protein